MIGPLRSKYNISGCGIKATMNIFKDGHSTIHEDTGVEVIFTKKDTVETLIELRNKGLKFKCIFKLPTRVKVHG